MALVIQFLNTDDSTFLATDPQHLQLRQLEPGKAALGVLIPRQKKSPDGTPLVGSDGKPEFESAFVPIIHYPMNISTPQTPKVELATDVPQSLKKSSRVSRKVQ